jgi:hypothetical protein
VNENAQVELRTPIPTAGMMVTGAGAMQPPNPHVKVLIEEHQMGGGGCHDMGGERSSTSPIHAERPADRLHNG